LTHVASIGQLAPLFSVSDWVQGESTNFDQLRGKVVLVEVFQVNCPGCFMHALPEAINLHRRYAGQGLVVIGIATAFEDFDKNTLENLKRLVTRREVIGETFHALSQQGMLIDGCLPYEIPFSLAMDRLVKREFPITDTEISQFIHQHLPEFSKQPPSYQDVVRQQVTGYLQKQDYYAETFGLFNLKGTPSQIVVDKQGILRTCGFGNNPQLEQQVQALLHS
jgi:thiol-disulfide isomerase/thioredoxin